MAAMPTTEVSVRLPNSISLWMPCSWYGTGVNEPGTHSGQLGHPSPNPVRRTSPPVTTMPIFEDEVGDQDRPEHAGEDREHDLDGTRGRREDRRGGGTASAVRSRLQSRRRSPARRGAPDIRS